MTKHSRSALPSPRSWCSAPRFGLADLRQRRRHRRHHRRRPDQCRRLLRFPALLVGQRRHEPQGLRHRRRAVHRRPAEGEAQSGQRHRPEPHSLPHREARRHPDERRLLEGARGGHRLRRRLCALLHRRDRPGRPQGRRQGRPRRQVDRRQPRHAGGHLADRSRAGHRPTSSASTTTTPSSRPSSPARPS